MKPLPIVSPSLFGKDHWSLLAYVECRNVDDRGVLDKRHLRCNPKGAYRVHAVNAGLIGTDWPASYGTKLRGYWCGDGTTDSTRQLPTHDDWCCLADLEAAGYVEIESEVNAHVKLTKSGVAMAALLRAHKAAGGQFAGFNPQEAHS